MIAAYVGGSARLLKLTIGSDLLPSVVNNYRRLIDAENLLSAVSGDLDEPAPLFNPCPMPGPTLSSLPFRP